MTDGENNAMKHPDLNTTRIKQDEEDIKSLLVMFCSVWQVPTEKPDLDLSSISTGATLSDVILDDLNVEKIGKVASETFILRKLSEQHDMKFFDKEESNKRKKQMKVSTKSKKIILKEDNFFLRIMTLTSQRRKLDM